MGRSVVLWLSVALAIGVSDAGAGGARTSITVFSPPSSPYGGLSYGATAAPANAMITERRQLDVTSGGEVRLSGVAATIDPATVQLRSLTAPGSFTVSEQRFVAGASTPDELLARHVGDAIAVVTPKGEIAGVLRSVDEYTLVLEVGSGDQRRLQLMRRDYVQDIRLPAGKAVDQPSLVWRLATKQPGKHDVEVTYRASGLSWSADYLAVYDEAKRTLDFSAWATVRNGTGTTFDGAEVTLVSGGSALPSVAVNPYTFWGQRPVRQATPPVRFTVPAPIRVGDGESVQVELLAPRIGAKVRSVVTYEAVNDLSINYQQYPATDCTMMTQTAPGSGRAEVAIEIDLPNGKPLPDGRIRVFKRAASSRDRLDVLGDDQLYAGAKVARIRLAAYPDLVGERKTTCNLDERMRTLTEKVEVKLANRGKHAVDAVVREFLWRYPIAKIDPADESTKGTRARPQTQEYRVSVPAGGKKTVTYTVVYQW